MRVALQDENGNTLKINPDGTLAITGLATGGESPTGGATELTLAAILVELNQKLEPGGEVALSPATLAALENIGVTVANFPSSQTVAGSVSVTNLPATQPISGTVGVNNFPATQPISGSVGVNNFPATQPISGTVTVANPSTPSTLAVTSTGAAGAAVTLTLPAVASQFHYLTRLEICLYSTAARAGTATPVIVTSTNLPGTPAFTFPSVGAIGTTETRVIELDAAPLKSSVVNVPTTIICPIVTSALWRVNVTYFTGA